MTYSTRVLSLLMLVLGLFKTSLKKANVINYFFLRILVFFLVFLSLDASAQRLIQGVVLANTTGEGLSGVIVTLKDTDRVVATDSLGHFEIITERDDVLVFSFSGFEDKEMAIGAVSEITVVMQENKPRIVTALGLELPIDELPYSAQNVNTQEFSEARSLNVSNSLAGKVAGLQFSTTGNGVGSSSRISLRGNRSHITNNQPLVVIDGVPMDNNLSATRNEFLGETPIFTGISMINPEDIASIAILKGNAAALYGIRGANGAIMITTKKGVSGRAKVAIASNFMLSKAYDLSNFQNEYGQGVGGAYDPTSRLSWGPKMEGQTVDAWQLSFNPDYTGPATYSLSPQTDNVNDFFKTGYNWSRSVSASMGNQLVQGYFSYTNTTAEGIVTGNELNRHNVNVRMTSDLTNKLHLDAKTTFISQTIDNAIKTGEGSVAEGAYTLIRSMPFGAYKEYQYIDATGNLQYNYPSPMELGGTGGNPYWLALKQPREDEQNRFISFVSAKYDFTEHLSLQLRSGFDRSKLDTSVKSYAAIGVIGNDFGNYSEDYGERSEHNTDFLLAFNRDFNDLSVGVNFGYNLWVQKVRSSGISGSLLNRNVFDVNNLGSYNTTSHTFDRRINSIYGFTQIGFKEVLFLDVSARQDRSDTGFEKDAYISPAIGVAALIGEILNLKPKWMSHLKIRANYARMYNDFFDPDPTMGFSPSTFKIEPTISQELGLTTRLFQNRVGLDAVWYKTKTSDQMVFLGVSGGSGYSSQIDNGGEIENKGVELVLTAALVDEQHFRWDMTTNFSKYTTKVLSVLEGATTVSPFSVYDGLAGIRIKEGGEYGDLYIRGFVRNDDGDLLVGEDGIPEITPGLEVLAGNYNPDWIGGIQNRMTYKDFSLSFLVDIRMGGEVISYSQVRMAAAGVSDLTLSGRDGFVVDGVVATRNDEGTIVSTTPNATRIVAEQYWSRLGARYNEVAEDFVFDATNIRLRELVLEYSLPSALLDKSPFSAVNFSLVGRNLFFMVNKAKYFDPEQNVGIGNLQGLESFNAPATRNYGVNVNVTF